MMRLTFLFVAATMFVGCLPSPESAQQERFKQAVLKAPPMGNPATSGRVDPVASGNWDSSFRMISFTPSEVCFLAEWNVPPSLAPSLPFKLAGWRNADETAESAPTLTSKSVEVLDSATLAKVKHYDVYTNERGDHATMIERRDKEQAMYETAMRVCFPSARDMLASARYLVITVDADERHRTGAAWQLK
jgi:hypothetical protein